MKDIIVEIKGLEKTYGKNEAEKPTNICYVINRNGEIVGNYEKIHLFDAFNVKVHLKKTHAPNKKPI